MRGGASTQSALALAKLCYETLLDDSCRRHSGPFRPRSLLLPWRGWWRRTRCFRGLVLSRPVSRQRPCRSQRPDGVTATNAYYHGEKVAYGLMVQLVLEGQPRSVLERVLGFSSEVGLPITLAEIGLTDLPKELLYQVASRSPPKGKPFTMNPSRSARTWWPTRSWLRMQWEEPGKNARARDEDSAFRG